MEEFKFWCIPCHRTHDVEVTSHDLIQHWLAAKLDGPTAGARMLMRSANNSNGAHQQRSRAPPRAPPNNSKRRTHRRSASAARTIPRAVMACCSRLRICPITRIAPHSPPCDSKRDLHTPREAWQSNRAPSGEERGRRDFAEVVTEAYWGGGGGGGSLALHSRSALSLYATHLVRLSPLWRSKARGESCSTPPSRFASCSLTPWQWQCKWAPS